MLEPITLIDAVRRPQVGVCTLGLSVGGASGTSLTALEGDGPEAADPLIEAICGGRWHALLIAAAGRPGSGLKVQLRVENRAADGASRLFPTGPAVARATAPASELVRALQSAGFDAQATSEGPRDAAGRLMYRVLLGLADCADAPPVGLLRVPSDAAGEVIEAVLEAGAKTLERRLAPLSPQLAG